MVMEETGDMDLWLNPENENKAGLLKVLSTYVEQPVERQSRC
jgi:hypothetical protein